MVDFSQKDDGEGEPTPDQPIVDAGFVAHEQGFKAVEPGVGVFDHDAAGVKFGVEGGVVVGLPVGGAAVAGMLASMSRRAHSWRKAVVSKALSAFRNSPAMGIVAASSEAQISPNKALSWWVSW